MTQRDFNKLLRDVSRSFYLSMRFLPGKMRGPVSLGYLLARASDTLADTAKAPLPVRIETLAKFREAVLNDEPLPRLDTFFRHQSHAGEKVLLTKLDDCLIWMKQLNALDYESVRGVLDKITVGQQWDLKKAAEIRQRPVSHDELEQYTYSVAGCVGEFWTRVGYDNLGKKFADPEDREALMHSGKMFGQGLQLINILRDIGEDLENGRCYLPVEKTIQQGLIDEPTLLLREMSFWQATCRDWIGEGWNYLEKVRHHRVRFATALPLIIGERTLTRLEAEGENALSNRIKIDRKEVKQILWKAWWARKSVDKLHEI